MPCYPGAEFLARDTSETMPSTTSDEIVDALAADAVDGIQSASNGAGSVTATPIADRLAAAEAVANSAAVKKGKKPFRIFRMPGA